jgi:hypothetical protein
MKLLTILLFPFLATGQKTSIGVGYMNFWTVNAEFKINKANDELRLFLHGDNYYPITKLAVMYQPYIKPIVWQVRPVIAIGPSVGFWRDRSRAFYYATDAQLSSNSTWKKNPVIGIDGLAGIEAGTGRVSVEMACHYWLCLNNNFFGSPRLAATVKYNF